MLQSDDDTEEVEEDSKVDHHQELANRKEAAHQSEVAQRLAHRLAKQTEMHQNTEVRNFTLQNNVVVVYSNICITITGY